MGEPLRVFSRRKGGLMMGNWRPRPDFAKLVSTKTYAEVWPRTSPRSTATR